MLARQMPTVALTSLSHHIDMEWMKEALLRTRADGATGVDGVTCEEYVRNLEVNLQGLLDRAKAGRYRALPVRRVHISKGESGSETSPIGIPTFELSESALMISTPRNRTARAVTPRRNLVLRLNQLRCAECHASAQVRYLRPFVAFQTAEGFIVRCKVCHAAQLPPPATGDDAMAATTGAFEPAAGTSLRAA